MKTKKKEKKNKRRQLFKNYLKQIKNRPLKSSTIKMMNNQVGMIYLLRRNVKAKTLNKMGKIKDRYGKYI